MSKCEDIKTKYIESLIQHSVVRSTKNGCILLVPFLQISGEFIAIHYQFLDDNSVIIHDNGDTISELHLRGVEVLSDNDSKGKELLIQILRKFNFEVDGWTIKKIISFDEVGNATLDAINCLKSVFDLMFLHRANPSDPFKSLVTRFLNAQKITFVREYRISGKATQHTIDYAISAAENRDQIFLNICHGKRVKTIAEHSGFSCVDIRNAGHTFQWVPIINPEDDWNEASKSILRTYSDRIIEWGNHEDDFRKLFSINS